MTKDNKIKMKFSSATILNKYPPIEVDLDGKVFTVAERLPLTMFAAEPNDMADEKAIEFMVGHMARLFGVEVKEIEDLNLDIRVFREVLEGVQEKVMEQIQSAAKNPTVAESSSRK